MTLRLHNTLTRKKEDFVPQDPSRVTMYVCGPTVYNHAHIGNFRPPVVFDVLFRLLRHLYGTKAVVYARNITDIEDKIIARALEEGVPLETITSKYAQIYRDESAVLNVLPPSLEPTATGHIGEMIEIMQLLEEKGHAYTTASGLFFHVPSMENYGRLSGRKQDDNQAGASDRVKVDTEKKDSADFALWKFAKPDEPEDAIWESPWGRGRPGWHIECSAMAAAQLGKTIDIHGGGIDLQFPHHENEIAQSECAHDAQMARYWLHNGFLDIDGEKMAKSLGNVKLVRDLLEDWPGEVIRFALLSGHYRAPLDYTISLLEQSKTTLTRLYGTLGRLWDLKEVEPQDASVIEALLDDINTPLALSAVSQIAHKANAAADAGNEDVMIQARADLMQAARLLGILQSTPDAWAKGGDEDDTARIDAMVEQRTAARAAKDWAEADRLRDLLASEGIEIMDTAGGVSWRRK